MVRRQIDLDEDSDRILSELAEDYRGNFGEALADVLHAHKSLEDFAQECEDLNRDSLLTQRERGERGFREGRFTPWDEVKRRHDL